MARPVLYAAITHHGFGHTTRSAAVLADLQQRCPDLRLIIVTTAPRWLLDSYLSGDYIYRPLILDVGAVQSDSMTIDRKATLQALKALRSQQDALVQSEGSFIREHQVSLVYGDIPPLAAYIAKAAGIPCWMSSNFGWDLIYQDWGDAFTETVNWVRDGFRLCDRLFRLPFHESMSAFPQIEDVGLTGAQPHYSAAQLLQRFSLQTPRDRTAMLTFGGLGLQGIPYENMRRFPDWQFLTFDTHAPKDLANLLILQGKDIRPVDLMPICGRLITKPGYGTFSEASLQDVPIVALPRAGFAEAESLIRGIQDHSQHLILQPQEFERSDWAFLNRPLSPPQTRKSLPKTGNEEIVEAIAQYLLSPEVISCCTNTKSQSLPPPQSTPPKPSDSPAPPSPPQSAK